MLLLNLVDIHIYVYDCVLAISLLCQKVYNKIDPESVLPNNFIFEVN